MTAKEIIRAVKKTDIHASFFASDDMKYPDGRRPATAEDYKRLCGEENIGISVAAAEMRTEGGHLCQSNEDIVILSKESGAASYFTVSVDPRMGLHSDDCDLGHFIEYYKKRGAVAVGYTYGNIDISDREVSNLFRHSLKCGMTLAVEAGIDTVRGLSDDESLSGLKGLMEEHRGITLLVSPERDSAVRMIEPLSRLMSEYEGVYTDLSSFDISAMTSEELRAFKGMMVSFSSRCLYGTYRRIYEEKVLLGGLLEGMLLEGEMKEEEYIAIVSSNAERIFSLCPENKI